MLYLYRTYIPAIFRILACCTLIGSALVLRHILSRTPSESRLLLDFRPYAVKPSIFLRRGVVTITTITIEESPVDLSLANDERGNHGSYYPTVNHGSNYPSQWEAFEW